MALPVWSTWWLHWLRTEIVPLRGQAWVFFFRLRQFSKVLVKRASIRKNSSHSHVLWARLTQNRGGDGWHQSFPTPGTWHTTACPKQDTSQPGDRRGSKSSLHYKCSTFLKSDCSKKLQRLRLSSSTIWRTPSINFLNSELLFWHWRPLASPLDDCHHLCGQRFLATMTNKFKFLMTLFDIALFESSIEFLKLFFLFVFFSCSNYRI